MMLRCDAFWGRLDVPKPASRRAMGQRFSMSMMALETLNEFEKVGTLRIGECKRNNHNSMLLKRIIDCLGV